MRHERDFVNGTVDGARVTVAVEHHFQDSCPPKRCAALRNEMRQRVRRFLALYTRYVKHFRAVAAVHCKMLAEKHRVYIGALRQKCMDHGLLPHQSPSPDSPPDIRQPEPLGEDFHLEMHELARMDFFHDAAMQRSQLAELRNVTQFGPTKFHVRANKSVRECGYSTILSSPVAKKLRKVLKLRQPQTEAAASPRHPLAKLGYFGLVLKDGELFVDCGSESGWGQGVRKTVAVAKLGGAGAVRCARKQPEAPPALYVLSTRARYSPRCDLIKYGGHHWRLADWFHSTAMADRTLPALDEVLSPSQISCKSWADRGIWVWQRLRHKSAEQRLRRLQTMWQPLQGWVLFVAQMCGESIDAYAPLKAARYHTTTKLARGARETLFHMAASPLIAAQPAKLYFLRKLAFETGTVFVRTQPQRSMGSTRKRPRAADNTGNQFCRRPTLTGASLQLNSTVPWAVPRKKQHVGNRWDAPATAEDSDSDDWLESFAAEMEDFLDTDEN